MSSGECREYMVRISTGSRCRKRSSSEEMMACTSFSNKLQRGIAPGQFAAWYDGDE